MSKSTALMMQETWESFAKLPHDVTVAMEQVSSELLCPWKHFCRLALTVISPLALYCGGTALYQKHRLVSKRCSDDARDLGKLCKAVTMEEVISELLRPWNHFCRLAFTIISPLALSLSLWDIQHSIRSPDWRVRVRL